MLRDKIVNKKSGILLYGLTPPKLNIDKSKIQLIANKLIERVKHLPIDGLVLYDIQDESARTNQVRPFPFNETLTPDDYSNNYLGELKIPKIIYKSVGKYTANEFKNWIDENSNTIDYSVFVGTPSDELVLNLPLNDAYKINRDAKHSIPLGGVTIPERHYQLNDEHLRIFGKIDKGCKFFISQCIYNTYNTKNFLSDYHYYSIENNKELQPIIFTLTPCGSLKSLEFMEWLGIDFPKWLKNEFKYSKDMLVKSIDTCKYIARELIDYSNEKNIPIGFNIESVSVRKEDVEASVELLKDVKVLMNEYEYESLSLSGNIMEE
ncbi:methylenetetrahydrofolate reductase [Flavivirga eckloniae]|uniref:Methylenetetrahydrofolate reductase n=1 Tax=Flavivirga eckloniae TaxID=1803846 RepID=A0A2K9PSR6_9FLAO|nr:methylenetetrahydrofolate reductase [Flavivirga eckloniae]AUP80110.1 5,10-methylenetetrahydrofolate reductase [Flavivirga eckloniae]